MPITKTHVKIAGGVAVVGAVGYGAWRLDKKRQAKAEALRRKNTGTKMDAEKVKVAQADLKCLRDNYLQNRATLSESIYDSLSYARRYLDPDAIISLNARTQSRVFDTAVQYAEEGDTGDRDDMDTTIRRLLRQALPECDWSRQAWPAEPGSDWELAITGVTELFQLAVFEMRYGNYHPLPAGGGAGIVCPGWRQTAPAATSTLRPFDYVEILVGIERQDGEPIKEEFIHATVSSTNGDTITVIPVEGGEPLPDGSRAKGPMYSEEHGFGPDRSFTIPRRCVFRVIKK